MSLEIVEAVQAAKRCEDAARKNKQRETYSHCGVRLEPQYKNIAHPAVSGAVAGRCADSSRRSK
ncbi:hypothetical protein [Notoacmeibacter ruber]|uniref:Uncharacterized protein n=1 Tax=Notoacmeibacter ruber TaxID=2670375 RepID=A0A3L7JA80_9HYPH|nr:hypothetical protein [Notoacmeibacter ruber]RLQ87603.1 hypothetical protein D8780_04675 [Notoacmeibacter ruber]